MAANLPDALQLRDVKYGEKSTAKRKLAVAGSLFEAGRTAEALDLYLLVGDDPGIERCRTKALREGHPVPLLMLRRAGHEIGAADWKAAGDVAFGAGRWREAYRCFQEADDEAGLEKLREKLPDYDIYTPQGK